MKDDIRTKWGWLEDHGELSFMTGTVVARYRANWTPKYRPGAVATRIAYGITKDSAVFVLYSLVMEDLWETLCRNDSAKFHG